MVFGSCLIAAVRQKGRRSANAMAEDCWSSSRVGEMKMRKVKEALDEVEIYGKVT